MPNGTISTPSVREVCFASEAPAGVGGTLNFTLCVAQYWLELLYKTNYVDEATYKNLDSACTGIRVMLIASVNTVKPKQ